jgi:hypothetical protein
MATIGRAVLIDLSHVEALPTKETYWERGPDGDMQRVTVDVKTRGRPQAENPHPEGSAFLTFKGTAKATRRKRPDDLKIIAQGKARWGNGLEGLRREKSREIAALRAEMKRDGRSRRETRKATAKLLRHYAKLEATMMRDK